MRRNGAPTYSPISLALHIPPPSPDPRDNTPPMTHRQALLERVVDVRRRAGPRSEAVRPPKSQTGRLFATHSTVRYAMDKQGIGT
jgi:hypothetical protein